MPLFLWKRSYETGIPEIDYDHRQLVGIINELYEAMKTGQGCEVINRTIDRLLEYSRRHFASEEGFMRACAYPDTAGHEQSHREMTERIVAMDAQRRAGGSVPSPEMLTFLRDWLCTHIAIDDKKLGEFLRHAPR